jgi:hypothetical protein
MNIHDRLKVFYDRLAMAPPAGNASEAFALICRTLEQVEREFCPVPGKSPPPKTFDGRMYIPQADNLHTVDNAAIWVKTRKHRIAIRPDGSFAIFKQMPHRTLLQEFQKSAASR